MLFVDIIRKKRDGGELNQDEIDIFVDGLADGSIPAEQVSALAMAIFLNSMSMEEAGALTRKMAGSGRVLDWQGQDLGGPVVDKHSTGGIGDKVSFLLAPIAAACGCFVPMISGRGLGHSGGTVDKVGSIPGYDPFPDIGLLRRTVKTVGCAIIGQTSDLAPADRRLYAIRDVTGTVESVPLITASILSKKIAAGLDGLVMDVKCGSGAFMTSLDEAAALARSIIGTAGNSGLATHALITDMNQNLGHTAGNALEIAESVEYLANLVREPRLDEVTIGLAAEMQLVGGIDNDRASALRRAKAAVSSGAAAEIFARMIVALGGPDDFVENYRRYLPAAEVQLAVVPREPGYLAKVNGRDFGNAIVEMGGGRRTVDDELDLAVGFSDVAAVGTFVDSNRPLAIVHARDQESAGRAGHMLIEACTVTPEKTTGGTCIYQTLGAE